MAATKEDFGFFGSFGSKKLFLYAAALCFLFILIGYVLIAIGAIVGGGAGLWLNGIGGSMRQFVKLLLGGFFLAYGALGDEDTTVRAGLLIGAAWLIVAM
ncbi:MAG: hypothetical protein V1911_02595 [Candidatus Micrarchaeota archaeon]